MRIYPYASTSACHPTNIAPGKLWRWFNHRRLHGEIGLVPPAEFKAEHWAHTSTQTNPDNPVLTEAGTN